MTLVLQITGIESLECSLRFYTKGRTDYVYIDKGNLFFINGLYYASIGTETLKTGHLMCSLIVNNTAVIDGYTGCEIGGCGGKGRVLRCGKYTIGFEKLPELPIQESIYYGVYKNNISEYNDITPDIIAQLSKDPESNFTLISEPGDKIIIAIPVNSNMKAEKDNGFGGSMPFSTSVMGANGDVQVIMNGITYKIYGEFSAVGGTDTIYLSYI